MSSAGREHEALRRQAVWVVGARIVGIAATLAANILAARLLGPAAFGIFLLLITFMMLGAMLCMLGLDEAAVRFISERLGLGELGKARSFVKQTFRYLAMSAPICMVLAVATLALMAGRLLPFGRPGIIIAATTCGIALLAWQRVGAEILRALGDLKSASLYSGGITGGPISNAAFLLALAIGGWLSAGQMSLELAVLLLVGSIAITLPWMLLGLRYTLTAVTGPKTTPTQLPDAEKNILIGVGLTLLVNQLLAFGTQQLDIFIGGVTLDADSLGNYGAAKRCLLIAAMPVQMAMMTVVATIPRLHAQQRTIELQRILRGTANLAAIPALVALAVLAIFPQTLPQLLFGKSFDGSSSTILILILGYLPLILLGNPPYVLTMTGRHRTVLGCNLAATLVLATVGTFGAVQYGAAGLATGSALSFLVQNGLLWWFAHRRLGLWTNVGYLSNHPVVK